MCSAYKLNKQGDNIQSHALFPISNHFVIPCPVLTVVSWPAHKFCRKQVRSHLFKNFPLFVVIHTVKGLSEADVFLELSCFFYDPTDVGNLISGSSAFPKSHLYICKFLVHVLLKPSLEDFEHKLASMRNECNCTVVWTSLALFFFGIRMKTDLFQSCGHCWVFQICWHTKCSTFTASFRIWNCSARSPSPPLALFIVMLPKAHLTLHSRISGLRWVITPLWLSGSLRSFLYSSSVYSCHLFLIFCFC